MAIEAGPPATVERRHHLPVQVSSFVGREQELAALRLLCGSSRLVTVTGPGGTGKTRLALEVAAELVDQYEDGVFFVDLSTVSRSGSVVAAAASALKVREHPGRPVLETVVDALGARRLLIVLDNCEHVVDECAELVAGCLRACPGAAFLTTSREPLAVAGENVLRLQPLPPVDAMALFAERARPLLSDFDPDAGTTEAVALLCKRVDGIPLAIELAAARTASMSVQDICARIDDRFGLLSAGRRSAPARHRTLRATIDWSFDLLDEDEQDGFLCLSAFSGAFDTAAASDIWRAAGLAGVQAIDLLGSLVAKSLLQAERAGTTTRYRLLDSFKQYAAERLALRGGGAATALLDHHAAIYLKRAKSLSPLEVGTKSWLDGLDADHDNLDAAFRHLVGSHQVAPALELASTLRRYWHWRGSSATTVTLLERCLADRVALVDDAARAQALVLLGDMYRMTDVRRAGAPLAEALDLSRSLSDRELEADALETMAFVKLREGEDRLAAELCEQALTLSRLHDTPLRRARKLSDQAGVVASAEGRLDEGIAMCVEALEIFRRHHSLDDTTMALNNLGWLELERRSSTTAPSTSRRARGSSATSAWTSGCKWRSPTSGSPRS
jgi:predicted ATPase